MTVLDYSKEDYLHSEWDLQRRQGHLYAVLFREHAHRLAGRNLFLGCNTGSTLQLLESLGHKVGITRSMLRLLYFIERDEDMHRIEASVEKSNSRAVRWIQYLGFDYEGDMPNYGLGGVGTFSRFARLN